MDCVCFIVDGLVASCGMGSLGAGKDLESRPKHLVPLLQMFLIKKKSTFSLPLMVCVSQGSIKEKN